MDRIHRTDEEWRRELTPEPGLRCCVNSASLELDPNAGEKQ